MGWIVLLPAWAALFVISKRVNPRRGANVVSILTMVVAFAAGLGLAYTFLGRWFAAVVGWVGATASNISGEDLSRGVPVALTLLVLLIAVADIAYDKKADKGALVSAMLLPTLLMLVVGGALGETGGDAVRTSYAQLATMMNQLGGS